jgi:dipeptidyl-peptidase-4
MARHSTRWARWTRWIVASGAVAGIAALVVATPSAQPRATAADFVSPAFPFGLVAAKATDRLAWISYDEGKRNVFTAVGPDFKPVRLTSFMDDDGVDLSDLSLSADGAVAVFVRGHARNRDGWVANPLSNPDGTERAIWAVRTTGGTPFRLAEIDTGAPVVSPDGKHALYVKDGQIFNAPVVSTPGKTPRDRGEVPFITVFGQNGNPRWAPDSSRFAFVSNRSDHSFIGVFEIASRKITWIAPDVDRDTSPTWSQDGTRVAFIRRPGLPFGQQQQQGGAGIGNPAGAGRQGGQGGRGGATGLMIPGLFRAEFRGGGTLAFWTADVKTGEAREFWRHDPAGTTFRNINAIQWAGDHVIFTTQMPDDEYDRYFSVALNGSTKEPVMITTTDGIIEDASSINLSPDGKTLFYTTNHGDIDRRDIFAVATAGGTPRQVTETPAIETQPVPLPSGKVAVLYADHRVPQSVGIVPSTGGRAAVVYPTLAARYPLARHVEPTNVTLEASDGVKFNNQLFLPKDIKPGERRPAMVFVHGGPQRQMLLGYHYRHVYHMFYGINQWLTDKGYIVLSVNFRRGVGYGRSFRQAPNSGGQGNAEYLDVLAAGQYLHSRPDVDPTRVGIWGLSYGGVLTAQALARNSDLFAAGIDLAGVHLWGSSLDPESTSFKSSPIGAIDGWKSPILLQHGDDDRNVDFTQTTGLVQMLRARNIEYELIVFPDDVHDSLVHSRWIYIFDRMDAFLLKHIGR